VSTPRNRAFALVADTLIEMDKDSNGPIHRTPDNRWGFWSFDIESELTNEGIDFTDAGQVRALYVRVAALAIAGIAAIERALAAKAT